MRQSEKMKTMEKSISHEEQLAASSVRLLAVSREIEATESAIRPLVEKLERLKRERCDLESVSFIAANKIRKDEVEMSSGAGKPWFGTVHEFGRWMVARAIQKPWAEWNGRIYHASDLMNGRMPDMPGCTSDLND
jgi:hypothetical protein